MVQAIQSESSGPSYPKVTLWSDLFKWGPSGQMYLKGKGSKVFKGYIVVKGIQRVYSGLMYPRGISWS